jgi:hypothetical protein
LHAVFDLKKETEEERNRQLEDIEGSGFHQASFKSSRTDRSTTAHKNSHDSAIFGKQTESKCIKTEADKLTSQIERLFNFKLPSNLIGVDLKGLIAHPALYECPKARDIRWKNKWLEMRKKKIESGYFSLVENQDVKLVKYPS